MAISFPLSLPNFGFSKIQFTPKSVVAVNASAFTGQQQVYAYTGQWWEADITLPPMKRATAAPWIAFLCGLNGREGTFSLGDSIGRAPQGTISGSPTVGSGAIANTTTLPISGGGGSFAVGDWLQVSTFLHLVTQVNAGSVDVFPKLRASYASGSAIVYSNTVGLFRLKAEVPFSADPTKIYQGITIPCVEALS